MKVRFTADFDWKPSPQVTQAFRTGDEKVVTKECGEAAVAKGKAVAIDEAPPQGIAETIKRTRRKRNG